jgi:hypothetical protein
VKSLIYVVQALESEDGRFIVQILAKRKDSVLLELQTMIHFQQVDESEYDLGFIGKAIATDLDFLRRHDG